MKFRNPKTGAVFCSDDIEFCGEYACRQCAECPLAECQRPCSWFILDHPYEAAHLMGYEVIEDDAPTPECDSQGVAFDRADQSAKTDAGKIRPTLVPPALIEAVSAVREYGCSKYHDPDNWRRVEPQRYWEATLRHALAAWDNYEATDAESGLPHLDHMACDIAFILQIMKENKHGKSY